jgi:MFS family permease
MFSVAVVMLCLSQARSVPTIVGLAACAGLTGELYRPASSALLADLVPPGQRVTAWAAFRVAFNAGWTFGPATAGLLAKKSFLWLFVGDAFTSILFGLVAWFALPAGVRGARAGNALSDTIAVIRTDRRFRRLLLGSLFVWLVFVQVFSTMSLEVTRNGFSVSTYGLLISLNGLLVVLFELPLTAVTKRFPRRRVLALGYVLIGLGFASNVFPRTLLLLLLTMILLTFGEMISMPLAGAYVADLAPPHQRGLYMGTYGLVGAAAFILGPSLGLWIFSVSPFMLWASCGVLGLVAAATILGESQAGMERERLGMRSPSI